MARIRSLPLLLHRLISLIVVRVWASPSPYPKMAGEITVSSASVELSKCRTPGSSYGHLTTGRRSVSWLFPRDPHFAQKAAPVLDLYQRCWEGQPLHDDEFVISADEKTSIHARRRTHVSIPTRPRRARRVEHEYQRCGAWAYLAALDVHRAHVVGRCETKTGIMPFRRLVEQVMATDPYRQARRVFWIVDNGSSHRGARSIQRAKTWDPRLQLVHTPRHASWLNQIEIYFSIVQRKVLTRGWPTAVRCGCARCSHDPVRGAPGTAR